MEDEHLINCILESIINNKEIEFMEYLINKKELINLINEMIKDYLIEYNRQSLNELYDMYMNKNIDPLNFNNMKNVLINIKKNRIADSLTTSLNMFSKNNNDCCCICLEKYYIFNLITTTRCNHKYHKNCISNWLNKYVYCPLCMTSLCN